MFQAKLTSTQDAIGAFLATRIGARLIKPLLVMMTTAMALRLMWDWI